MNILIFNDHAFICQVLGPVRSGVNSNGKLLELTPNSPPLRAHQAFSDTSNLRGVAISVIVLSRREDTEIDNQMLGFATTGVDQLATNFMEVGQLNRVHSGPTNNSANASVHGGSIPKHRLSKVGLTDRQLDVLGLILQGKSNKVICRDLNLAEPTVKNHVTAILRALKVTNRTEAVIAARDMGCACLPSPAKSFRNRSSGPTRVAQALCSDSGQTPCTVLGHDGARGC
jgi:DNA-binding CsgD family transcriptional regulator